MSVFFPLIHFFCFCFIFYENISFMMLKTVKSVKKITKKGFSKAYIQMPLTRVSSVDISRQIFYHTKSGINTFILEKYIGACLFCHNRVFKFRLNTYYFSFVSQTTHFCVPDLHELFTQHTYTKKKVSSKIQFNIDF